MVLCSIGSRQLSCPCANDVLGLVPQRRRMWASVVTEVAELQFGLRLGIEGRGCMDGVEACSPSHVLLPLRRVQVGDVEAVE